MNESSPEKTKSGADKNLVFAIDSIIDGSDKVIDFGARDGRLMFALHDRGYLEVYGCDLHPKHPDVIQFDLEKDKPWNLHIPGAWEWGLCIEVGEHLVNTPHLFWILSCCENVIVSWALPGQRGKGHISCHSPEWVAIELYRVGLVLDETATATIRRLAGDGGKRARKAGTGWNRKLLVARQRSDTYKSVELRYGQKTD